MNSWLRSHVTANVQASAELSKNPISTLLICLLIGFSLSIPGMLAILVTTADRLTTAADQEHTITAFLSSSVSGDKAAAFAASLAEQDEITAVRYLSPAQALAEFERDVGLGNTVSDLKNQDNPLPPTAILSLAPDVAIADLVQRLGAQEQIDEVIFDQIWVDRLAALFSAAERLLFLLILLLAGGVILVIGNTLRFSLLARTAEFALLAIIGADRAYLVRPFLYTGFWYGLGGALTAIIVIAITTIWVAGPLDELQNSFGVTLSPETAAPLITGLVLFAGPALGVLGAQVASIWLLE